MATTKTIFLAFTLVNSPIAKYFLRLSDEMIKRGYRVVIITSNQKKKLVSPNTNPAIFTWPSFRPTKLRDALFLIRLIKRYKPVLLISNFVADNICLTIAWLMRIPIRAFHQHLSFINYRKQKLEFIIKYKILRKKLLYRFSTDCLSVSKSIANEASELFKIPKSKIMVFYNALEDPLLAEPVLMDNPIHTPGCSLICAGQLIFRKGQDVLICAMKSVKHEFPHVKLCLLGNGPEFNNLQLQIDQSDLAGQITLFGNVSHLSVIEHMAKANIVIVPSRSEAFGYVVIEAMSVGTPVIASNVGGIPEIIRDGVDGFLVPPDDPDALAEKILLLLQDPNLRQQMGTNARQRFLEKFELSAAAEQQADWLDARINTTWQ